MNSTRSSNESRASTAYIRKEAGKIPGPSFYRTRLFYLFFYCRFKRKKRVPLTGTVNDLVLLLTFKVGVPLTADQAAGLSEVVLSRP